MQCGSEMTSSTSFDTSTRTAESTALVADEVGTRVEVNYFTEVCNEVLSEPRYSDQKVESYRFFHSAATRLLEHEASRTFSHKLVHLLEKIFATTLNLSILWPAFHKLAVGDTLKLEWKKLLEQVGVEVNPLFYQFITEEVFKKMLRAKVNTKTKCADSSNPEHQLTFEEMNTINYIGGYIIKQLHTKVVTKKEYVDTLLLLQSDLPTGLESAQWTEAVDRGGLTHISEMFYNCLIAIEKICRNVFDGDSSQLSDVKHLILDQALGDVDVGFYWDLAIGITPTEIGDELLKMTIDLYTTVRGNAFAKGFMEQYKQKNKKSTQKSKSLRKKLF